MSQKIQVRRGTDAARQAVTFDQGEPVYATDTKKIYFGDGSTAGGIPVGGFDGSLGDSFVIIAPQTGSNKIANGTLLRNSIIEAKNKNPYNSPRSDSNRFSILLYPGIYASTGLAYTMPIPRYTNIIGMGNGVVIDVSAHSDGLGMFIGSGHVNCENFLFVNDAIPGFVLGLENFDKPVTGVVFKNIIYSGNTVVSFLVSQASTCERTLIDNVNPDVTTVLSSLISTTSYNFKDLTIQNLNYVGPEFLTLTNNQNGSSYNTFENVILKNSTLKIKYISDNFFSTTGFINSKVVNCQIESGIVFNSLALSPGLIISDCQFVDTYNSNNLIFNNCVFRRTPKLSASNYTINISIGTKHPSFYNCSFLSTNNTTMVTGSVGNSGLFVNCIFNTIPFTGATGLFGPQGSRYDARYV